MRPANRPWKKLGLRDQRVVQNRLPVAPPLQGQQPIALGASNLHGQRMHEARMWFGKLPASFRSAEYYRGAGQYRFLSQGSFVE